MAWRTALLPRKFAVMAGVIEVAFIRSKKSSAAGHGALSAASKTIRLNEWTGSKIGACSIQSARCHRSGSNRLIINKSEEGAWCADQNLETSEKLGTNRRHYFFQPTMEQIISDHYHPDSARCAPDLL